VPRDRIELSTPAFSGQTDSEEDHALMVKEQSKK